MFFFPIGDDNPTANKPFVNWALLGICIAVFLWQAGLSMRDGQLAILSLGFVPSELFGQPGLDPRIDHVGAVPSIFSSMFMHGGWMHLLGNMAFLYIYGDNVEDEMGHKNYLLFYLICGVIAALTQAVAAPSSPVPMVGASGAISGVMGAYLVLHPFARIRFIYWVIIIVGTVMLPAWLVLGFWILGQLMNSAQVSAGEPGVAFLAHIGGFFAGVILVFFFKKKNVKAFQRSRGRAFQSTRIRRGRGSVPGVGAGPSDDRKGPWG